ncbi:MAG: hypothetical protein JNL89_09665 [Rhodanobacteraceae bacterium]|jgi:hypothetical protein|nr:hypothetical protein [Rhodanobacteraceae bacterium]
MQGLILLGWLSAAAVAAEPVTIEVPTHALASREHSKGATPARSLLERSQHAMSARLRADGSIDYVCDQSSAVPDLRFDRRITREER